MDRDIIHCQASFSSLPHFSYGQVFIYPETKSRWYCFAKSIPTSLRGCMCLQSMTHPAFETPTNFQSTLSFTNTLPHKPSIDHDVLRKDNPRVTSKLRALHISAIHQLAFLVLAGKSVITLAAFAAIVSIPSAAAAPPCLLYVFMAAKYTTRLNQLSGFFHTKCPSLS